MSDLTYGYVRDVSDLVWGPPVQASQRQLARAVRAGYDLVWADLSSLVLPPLARVDCAPRLAQVSNRVEARAHHLAEACGMAQAPIRQRSTTTVQPTTITATLRHVATAHELHTAPRQVAQVHDLLGRAEWSLARGTALVPGSPLVAAMRNRIKQADTAIQQGNLAAAAQMAEGAMETASELSREVERAAQEELSQSRAAGEALARAGGLWTALAGDAPIASWVARHAAEQASTAGEELRRARTAYAESRFRDAAELADRLVHDLGALFDQAQHAMAVNQRNQMAAETAQVLSGQGYTVSARLDGDRQVIDAHRHGLLMLSVSYDLEGRFEIDSRAGFHGSAKCAVEVNALLEALKERMSFEIEGRRYVGAGDEDAGRAARTPGTRRRLAAADLVDDVTSRDPLPARQQQLLAAAWARVRG